MSVKSGAFLPFVGQSDLSAAQLDEAHTNGKLPNEDTAVNPVVWEMIFPKGNARIRLENEVLELGDDIRGVLRRIIMGEQDAEIEIPVADVSYEMMVKYFGINPSDKSTSDTHKTLDGSYDGVALTGFPLLLQSKEYGWADGYKPKLGTGSDPESFFFCQFIPNPSFDFELDSKGQKIPVLKGKCVSQDGTTKKGIMGKYGTLTALT